MNRAEAEAARADAIARRTELRRSLLLESFDEREAAGRRLKDADRNARRQIAELNRIIKSLTSLIGDTI